MPAATDRPTDTIFESFAASSQRKLSEGVVEGVKIVGTVSRNGRVYPSETLRKAISLYEGTSVYFNHPGRGPMDAAQPRRYGDRFGALRNVRLGKDGLYGDLHYNPRHRDAQQFAWDAENATEGVGLSHNASVRYGADGSSVFLLAAGRIDWAAGRSVAWISAKVFGEPAGRAQSPVISSISFAISVILRRCFSVNAIAQASRCNPVSGHRRLRRLDFSRS